MMHCAHCGVRLEHESRSCPACGTYLGLVETQTGTEWCMSCGGQLARAWRHCTACGAGTPSAGGPRATHTSIAAEAATYRGRSEVRNTAPPAVVAGDEAWPRRLHA